MQSFPSAIDAVSAVRNTNTALSRAENIFRFPQTLLRKYVKTKIKIWGRLFKLYLAESRSSGELEKELVEYLLFVNEAIRSDNSRYKKTCLPFTSKK